MCSHDSYLLVKIVKTDFKLISPPRSASWVFIKSYIIAIRKGQKVGSRTENSANSRTERRALTTCANVVILSMFKGYGWSDKSPVGFTRWNPQQPNSHHGQQPCVEMYSTGEWGDTGCYSVKQFVCKMPRCKLIDGVSVDKTNKQSN